MNYDLLTTILGAVMAVSTAVGSAIQNGGKPTLTALLLAAVAALTGYLMNKGSNAPKPPAVPTGTAAPSGPGASIGKSSAFAALTLATVAVVALFLAACSLSTTFAQSLIAGEGALAILDPSLEATVAPYFNAAITSVENWKSGPLTAEAEEVLGDLASHLDLLPKSSPAFDEKVAALINFIENELAANAAAKAAKVELKSPADQEVFFVGWIKSSEGVSGPATGRKHVWTGRPIKSPAQLKKALKK